MAGRATLAASLSTVLGTLPVFLVGALAVFIRADLRFGEAALGLAVATFFGLAALGSYPAGRLAERLGAGPTTAAGAVLSVASLLGIAALASDLVTLLVFLGLAGVSNALAQIGSNLALARAVPAHRQGLAYGLKQAAIPTATLLAGLAVPALALTVGWRWAFGLAAALALPLALVHEPVRVSSGHRAPSDTVERRALPTRALVILAVGAGCAAGAANSLGGFLVESAVTDGVDAGRAGAVVAVASALGVVTRVGLGWGADRLQRTHLRVVAVQLAVGALGFALLAQGRGGLVPGALLGFLGGWSWPGLLNFAVVRANRTAPAAATGVTQGGVFVGGALGPVLFGSLVSVGSYPTAWRAMAALGACGSVLVLIGDRVLRRDVAPAATRGTNP